MITRRILTQGLAGGLLAACAKPPVAPVTIFAAASLETALTKLKALSPPAPLTLSFGASSAMARQIAQGAPADLFISADLDWMDWLEARRRLIAGTRRTLLTNRLVLIRTASARARGLAEAMASPDFRLAVADPGSVPAGRYARQSLTKAGLWDQLQPNLVPAENVRAALAYVARGEAEMGVVYATDARAEPRVAVEMTFPADSHAPILYPAALVRDTPSARAALDWLAGPKAWPTFEAEGFGRP